jgi:NAD(P)-dependent dehydrogenase (short-subunit alcohol dehydrogenase family)
MAVVVGGAGGIGRAICRNLAATGFRVALLDLNAAAGVEVLQTLPGEGHVFEFVDVTSEASVDAAFDLVETQVAASKLVVVSGGPLGTPAAPSNIVNVTLDEWNRTINLNATGTFLCLRKFAQLRVANQAPATRIVLFSSITGQVGGAVTGLAYPASKAAVMGLTRQAALDLAPYGIAVNAIAPGSVATDKFNRFVDVFMIKALEARTPLQRISSPEEIAIVACFLLSDACSYITGATIDVNGGALMR